MLVSQPRHFRRFLRRKDAAVAAVVRVLQADQRTVGEVDVPATDGRLQCVQVHHTVRIVGHGAEPDCAQRRRAAAFVVEDVGLAADDGFVPTLAVREQGGEVTHRAAGDEDGCFLPHQLRCHRLQPADRRVFAEDIVTDLRAGHRIAHGGRGMGNRVAA